MDLNAQFGQLRGLIHQTYQHVDRLTDLSIAQWLERTNEHHQLVTDHQERVGFSSHDELVGLLNTVQRQHPEIFHTQWRPYIENTLPTLGFVASTIEQLDQLGVVLPTSAGIYLLLHRLSQEQHSMLCQHPMLGRLFYLDIKASRLLFHSNLEAWTDLVRAPLSNCEGFRVSRCDLELEYIEVLADSMGMKPLKELRVDHNNISNQSAVALSRMSLDMLDVSANDLDTQWCLNYAPQCPPKIFKGDLNHFLDEGLIHLLEHVFDDRLSHLSMGVNRLTRRALMHLIEHPPPQLHTLHIPTNMFRDEDINTLLNATVMNTVEHLNVSFCQLSTWAFAGAEPRALRTLEVSGNPLDELWIDACIDMAQHCPLETIVAKNINLPVEAWRRLQEIPTLKRLDFHTPEAMDMERINNEVQPFERWTF